MTFNVQSWGRISSSSNNKVTTLQDGTFIGAPGMYTYISATDTIATIVAANYFSLVVAELNIHDLIFAIGTDGAVNLTVATLSLDARTVTTVQAVGVGDVDGPAGATDNALCRFDGVTGKIIQNGIVLESDLGDLTLVRTIENASATIALPSYTFTGDTDSGLWRSAANTLDLSTNAFRVMQWAAAPALSVNYHMFTASATTVSLKWSAVGTDAAISLEVVPKGTGALLNAVGAVATPSYSFTGDIDTGMWHSAANTIDFSAGGARQFQISSIALSVNWASASGSAAGAGLGLLGPGFFIPVGVADANCDLTVQGKGTGGLSIVTTATGTGATLRKWNPAGTFWNAWVTGANVANITYTEPTAAPTANGQVLSCTTAGVQSWVNNGADSWVESVASPVAMVSTGQYIANTAGLLTFNVPAVTAVGDTFEVAGQGAGGWLIQMNAGQTANLNGSPTTVAGSLASTNRYNCLKLVCTVANTTFTVVHSSGVITVA